MKSKSNNGGEQRKRSAEEKRAKENDSSENHTPACACVRVCVCRVFFCSSVWYRLPPPQREGSESRRRKSRKCQGCSLLECTFTRIFGAALRLPFSSAYVSSLVVVGCLLFRRAYAFTAFSSSHLVLSLPFSLASLGGSTVRVCVCVNVV